MEISWGNHTFFHSTSAPHLPPRFRFGLWGFDFVGSLTHLVGLLCDFCPLRQSFAQDFLQHIPHGLRLVFGCAKYIASLLPVEDLPNLNPARSAEFELPARRPLNCRLETEKFRKTFAFEARSWQDGVRETVLNLL